MVGKVINDKTIPPTKDVDLGKPKKFNNIPRPSKPKIIEGTAARLLIFISIKSVNFPGFENSSRYIEANIAIGKLSKKQIRIVKTDPITELATPADSGSRESPDEKYFLLKTLFTFPVSTN
jgi:hypothetical protein